METLEYYKQLDDLVADEVNIKNVVRIVGTTEEGELSLNYNREKREYTFVLPTLTQVAKDETVIHILSNTKPKEASN